MYFPLLLVIYFGSIFIAANESTLTAAAEDYRASLGEKQNIKHFTRSKKRFSGVSRQSLLSSYSFSDELISRDPEYRIYRREIRNSTSVQVKFLREVKVIAHYFDYWSYGFYHTMVAVADDTYYNSSKPGSGSRGWDLSMSRKHGHILRVEIDNRPKSLLAEHSLHKLKVSPACFTDKTDEEIMEHFQNYRGAYHVFGNNCVHQTKYLLKYLCGNDVADHVTEPYDKMLYKVSRGILNTFRSSRAKSKEWVVKEYQPKDSFSITDQKQ